MSFCVGSVSGVFLCVKVGVSDASGGSGDRSRLSWRHGRKVGARFLALAMEETMEHSSGKLAAYLKGALVLLLVAQVNQLVGGQDSVSAEFC